MTKIRKSCNSNADLLDKLILNDLWLVNKSYGVGEYDLLHLKSPADIYIDYLSPFSRRNEYTMTPNTAVCFFEYDKNFDSTKGLWNAIKYNDKKLLEKYIERFKDVKIIIGIDYSLFGDGLESDNIYNMQRCRKVDLWFIHELHKLVIPNITYSNKKSLDYFLDGLEDCNVVAFSTKGCLRDKCQYDLALLAIEKMVDTMKDLKKIIVYSDSVDDSKIMRLFKYAIDNGIEIVIPDNPLKNRHIARRRDL